MGADDVERDLGGMRLEGEPDPALVEHVENRVPQLGEAPVAGVDGLLGHRRKRVEQVPDGRPREPAHHLQPEVAGGAGGVLHGLDGPRPLRLGGAPHRLGGERVGPGVVRVADELAGEVVRDRPAAQPVLGQQGVAPVAVGLVGGGAVDVQVVSPARQLQPVEPEPLRLRGQLGQRQVGPLSREQRYLSRHRSPRLLPPRREPAARTCGRRCAARHCHITGAAAAADRGRTNACRGRKAGPLGVPEPDRSQRRSRQPDRDPDVADDKTNAFPPEEGRPARSGCRNRTAPSADPGHRTTTRARRMTSAHPAFAGASRHRTQPDDEPRIGARINSRFAVRFRGAVHFGRLHAAHLSHLASIP